MVQNTKTIMITTTIQNFADNEYLEDYLSSEARDEGVSFSDYEYNRRVDDYGWSSDDVDNGDDD